MIGRLLRKVYDFIYFQTWRIGLWNPPDRRFLTEAIFPYFAYMPGVDKILFVGVQRYTRHYEKYFSAREFVTVDPDERQRNFGARTHCICDVTDFTEGDFDIVFLNGVIGFGLDSLSAVEKAIVQISTLLKPHGWLVLGTNPTTFTADMQDAIQKNFEPVAAPFSATEQHLISFKAPLSRAEHDYRFLRLRTLEQ